MALPRSPSSEPDKTQLKTVLFVEDEVSTLRFYSAGLRGLHEFKFLLAENGQQALDALNANNVDVVVTDLNMPVMDGFTLITRLTAKYPSIPVLVVSGLPEPKAGQDALNLGAIRILSKPPRLSTLMEEIRAAAQRKAEGLVKGISIGSLLQLLSWEQKTCTLTVRSKGRVGMVYLRKGEVVSAAYHEHEGIVAAYEILSWEHPEIEFVETCRMDRIIDLPVAELLMNVAMITDQATRTQSGTEQEEGKP